MQSDRHDERYSYSALCVPVVVQCRDLPGHTIDQIGVPGQQSPAMRAQTARTVDRSGRSQRRRVEQCPPGRLEVGFDVVRCCGHAERRRRAPPHWPRLCPCPATSRLALADSRGAATTPLAVFSLLLMLLPACLPRSMVGGVGVTPPHKLCIGPAAWVLRSSAHLEESADGDG